MTQLSIDNTASYPREKEGSQGFGHMGGGGPERGGGKTEGGGAGDKGGGG